MRTMTEGVTPREKPFRGDIAGLRAIAVVAVVMYHFGVPGFKGGFSGVDVFFVISGFLMTGIISRGIDRGGFSLIGFYLARARRIVPALAVLCLVLMLVGWFILVPADYQQLGRRVASSISFLSNIQYWKDSSAYFTSISRENWLLHTWSLSVEWQFYMFFPIGMLFARRFFGRSGTRLLIVATTLLSFALCLYFSPRLPNVAFYTPATRAWEMLAGALVCLYPLKLSQFHRTGLEVIGAVILLGSINLLQPTDLWPGYLALLPVVGTAMMLIAANTRSPLTTSRVLQSLGDASYSIYLWHWPVFVYIVYSAIEPTPQVLFAATVISMVLGYLSYFLVEQPTRGIGLEARKVKGVLGYGAVLGSIFAMGVSLVVAKGFEWRASDEVNFAKDEGVYSPSSQASECTLFRGLGASNCVLGSAAARVAVIVLGDSHAEFTASAVVAAAGEGEGTLLLAYKGCMTIPDVHIQGTTELYQCGQFMRQQIDRLKTAYAGIPVVVTNRLSLYVLGFNENPENFPGPLAFFDKPSAFDATYKREFIRRYVAGICEIAATHPVYITAPIPELGVNVPSTYSRGLFRNGTAPDIGITRQQYEDRNAFALTAIDAAVKACGATVLDPTEYLCDKDRCNGVADRVPLYYDDNHLSAEGNTFLVPMYRKIWERQLSTKL
jgi:peptidoglycan/LPS O-acetylase OafA/YrhL